VTFLWKLRPDISRGEGVEEKEPKKFKKGGVFNSGAAAQPQWLAGHRAGTGLLTGEEGGAGLRILERGQSLSL